MRVETNCLTCGEPYSQYKTNHKFCSSLCRNRHYRKENFDHLKSSKRKWDLDNIEHKRIYERNALKKPNTREYRKNYQLKRYFGITLEQYKGILDKQDNKCPICFRPSSDFERHMPVDHSHVTGEIRGIVCGNCNVSVIRHFIDPEVYERAKVYLKNSKTGFFVPDKYKKGKKKS